MSQFDGDDFQPLDEEAFGDGETDGTTQPLSRYKEKRLDGNIRWCAKNAGKSTLKHRTTTNKKSGSLMRCSRFIQFIRLRPYDSKITVTMEGSIGYRGPLKGVVDAELRIYSGAEEETGLVATGVSSWVEGSGPWVVSATIDKDQIKVPTNVWVSVETKSATHGETLIEAVGYQGPELSHYSMPGAFKADTGNKDAGFGPIDGTTYIDNYFWREANGPKDFIGVFEEPGEHPKDPATPWAALYWWGDTDTNLYLADTGGWDLKALSWVSDTEWFLEIESDPTQNSGLYSPHLDPEMYSRSPVLGQHVSKHGINLDYTVSRPRTQVMGPSGGKAYGQGFDYGDGIVSDWTLAQAAPKGVPTYLDAVPYFPTYPKTEVTVRGLMLGVDSFSYFNNYSTGLRVRDATDEDLHRYSIDWPMEINFLTLGSGQEKITIFSTYFYLILLR